MSFRFLLISLPALAGASLLSAVAIEAPIVDVTVFPDRAVVTRAGSVQASAGVSEITVAGLPHDLVADSLQVAVRADVPLSILDVRSAARFGVPEGMDRLKPLLEEQKRLERKRDEIDMALAVLRQQKGFLEKVEASVTAPRPEADMPSPEEWSGLARYFQESLGELLPRMHEKNTILQKIKEELDAVNRQIAQTRGAERTRSREAVVRVETDRPAEARFTLSYTVMNAGWSPAYNVRVRSAEKDVQLDYQALVRQSTGEDWSGVNLTLSTARPAIGGTPPLLRPWIVDILRPQPAPRLRREAADTAALHFADLEQELSEKAVFRPVDVERGLTAVQLRAPVAATIPADGEPHRVGVGTFPLEGEFFYTIVPKLSPHAFLQSKATHTGLAPVLPGRANIFLDGNLVGHSQLPRVEPDEEVELPLGVDEAIVVERKLLRRFVDQRGIINKTTRTRYEFLTTITNRRPTAEKVVVRDHVPVSQHDRIKVELIELSGGKPVEDQPGFYEWEITLSPGQEARIPLVFVVDHPEEIDITGL